MEYKYHPKTNDELKSLINQLISLRGNKCDLNDIDVSAITDMSKLFMLSDFNGNISHWVVSNVTDMSYMFYSSKFNGDISAWDVHCVKCMNSMFAYSKFNGDISKWNVSNVKNAECIFMNSTFNGDIRKWNIRKVDDMEIPFYDSILNYNAFECDSLNVLYPSFGEYVDKDEEDEHKGVFSSIGLPKSIENVDYNTAKYYLNIKLSKDGFDSNNIKSLQALDKLITIAQVWNEIDDFVLDFENGYQIKWLPRFIYSKDLGKFVYSYSQSLHSIAPMFYSDKLCFKTKERSRQFGELFVDLWNDFFTK